MRRPTFLDLCHWQFIFLKPPSVLQKPLKAGFSSAWKWCLENVSSPLRLTQSPVKVTFLLALLFFQCIHVQKCRKSMLGGVRYCPVKMRIFQRNRICCYNTKPMVTLLNLNKFKFNGTFENTTKTKHTVTTWEKTKERINNVVCVQYDERYLSEWF